MAHRVEGTSGFGTAGLAMRVFVFGLGSLNPKPKTRNRGCFRHDKNRLVAIAGRKSCKKMKNFKAQSLNPLALRSNVPKKVTKSQTQSQTHRETKHRNYPKLQNLSPRPQTPYPEPKFPNLEPHPKPRDLIERRQAPLNPIDPRP